MPALLAAAPQLTCLTVASLTCGCANVATLLALPRLRVRRVSLGVYYYWVDVISDLLHDSNSTKHQQLINSDLIIFETAVNDVKNIGKSSTVATTCMALGDAAALLERSAGLRVFAGGASVHGDARVDVGQRLSVLEDEDVE